MKNQVAVLLGVLIALTPIVYAESELPQPGILPDSPFYGLQRGMEGIQLFFAFDDVSKANLHYKFAGYRLAEAEAMSDQNKLDLAEEALEEYEDELNETNIEVEQAIASGENVTTVIENANGENYKQLLVLSRLKIKVRNAGENIQLSIREHNKLFSKFDRQNLVNMTVTVGNETVIVSVPAKLADKFFEKVERYQNETETKLIVKSEKASEAIEAAEEEINKLVDLNLTGTASVLYQNARKHLEDAKSAYDSGKYGNAFGQATAAKSLAINAQKAISYVKPPSNETEGNETEDNETGNESSSGNQPGQIV